MAEVMTTYATSIYNFVGRRLSWSNNGEQQQRPSSHDLFEGSPRPSWLSNPSTYMLQAPLVSVVDQNDSDIDDAVSEQTLVAVEQIPIVLRRAPIPGAESPARGELAGGISDNSVGSDATASNSPIIPPPDGPISHITPATSLTTTETSIEGTNDTERMRSTALPEDDGQRPLRHLLQEIHNMDIPERERAKRMHLVMTEKYNALKGGNDPSKKIVRSGKADPFELMPGDAEKTYHKDSELGCSHYKRGVKLQCSTCHKWYTCRFCHDENEDHTLIRTETKNMLCMHCGKAQPVGQDCRHCGVKAACYYCDKVSLFAFLIDLKRAVANAGA